MATNYLNTTTRNIAWFKGVHDRKELDMKPPFQRNPVWTGKQKSHLMDSILGGYPIPEVYLQETVDANGVPKFIVVDGQQRIRSVLDFLESKFAIDPKESVEYGDLRFEDLSIIQKKSFFQYNFIIRILPDVEDDQLRSIFQRLNRNVVSLNKQELRNATYWGPFIKTMAELSDKSYWQKLGVFSANDIRRMLDIEYISELAIFILHGFQNKKDNLDLYYLLYEEEFEGSENVISTFDTVNLELLKILPELALTRWKKKSDFYSLFGFFARNKLQLPLSKEKRDFARVQLIDFGDSIDYYVKTARDVNQAEFSEAVKEYGKGIRATTDLGSRKAKDAGLAIQLAGLWELENQQVDEINAVLARADYLLIEDDDEEE